MLKTGIRKDKKEVVFVTVPLLSAQSMHGNLKCQGSALPDEAQQVEELGVFFKHPKGDRRQVAVDARVLGTMQKVYAASGILRNALAVRGARVGPLSSALEIILGAYRSRRLVWGFCGYASAGYPYREQNALMTRLYQSFKKVGRPILITDGGGGYGVLGLNGVLASHFELTSMGVTPLSGLAHMTPRTYTLVYGRSFPERQHIVGCLPDILVCIGGGDGAKAEREVAARYGVVVADLMPHSYGDEGLIGAHPVCRSAAEVEAFAAEAARLARRNLAESRAARSAELKRCLW